MSDSDEDNAYSDILGNRYAAIQKKRPAVQVPDSDSEDDFPESPKRSRRSPLFGDDSDEDGETVEKPVVSHKERMDSERMKAREEYQKQYTSTREIKKPIVVQNERSSVLKKTMMICEQMRKVSPLNDVDDEDDDIQIADESLGIDIFPLTIEIMDCELAKTTIHEISMSSTFLDIQKLYSTLWKCRIDEVMVSHKGERVDGGKTPKDLGFRPMQIPKPRIDVHKQESGVKEAVEAKTTTPGMMALKIQMENRKRPIQIEVDEKTTMLEVKKKILEAMEAENDPKIPTIEEMDICFVDEYIRDMTVTCGDVEVEDGDCFDIHCRK